jgi:hypothetical protein
MDHQNQLMWSKAGVEASSQGALTSVRCNPVDGSLYVSQGGKYSQAALGGRMFGISSQVAVAHTAAYAATYTGLAVGNPAGSGVNCSLKIMSFAPSVVSDADGTVGIMGGVSGIVPIVSALAVYNQKLDGPLSKCTATGGQTINAAPAPTLLRVTGSVGTGAVSTWRPEVISCDLDGSIVIPPGHFWASYCFMLSTAVLQFSFVWEEVPI